MFSYILKTVELGSHILKYLFAKDKEKKVHNFWVSVAQKTF